MEAPFQCQSCGEILDGSEDLNQNGICGICEKNQSKLSDIQVLLQKDAEILRLRKRVAELEKQLKEK